MFNDEIRVINFMIMNIIHQLATLLSNNIKNKITWWELNYSANTLKLSLFWLCGVPSSPSSVSLPFSALLFIPKERQVCPKDTCKSMFIIVLPRTSTWKNSGVHWWAVKWSRYPYGIHSSMIHPTIISNFMCSETKMDLW